MCPRTAWLRCTSCPVLIATCNSVYRAGIVDQLPVIWVGWGDKSPMRHFAPPSGLDFVLFLMRQACPVLKLRTGWIVVAFTVGLILVGPWLPLTLSLRVGCLEASGVANLNRVDSLRSAPKEVCLGAFDLWLGVETKEVVEVTDRDVEDDCRRILSVAAERRISSLLHSLKDVAGVAKEAANKTGLVIVVRAERFDVATHRASTGRRGDRWRQTTRGRRTRRSARGGLRRR